MIMYLGAHLGSQITSLGVFRRALPALDLTHFQRLEKLRYRHAFQGDHWFYIATSCPRLKELILYQLGESHYGQQSDRSGSCVTFPGLERLVVWNWRISYLQEVMERSTLPRLQDLNLQLRPPWKEGLHPKVALERIRKQTSGLTALGLGLPVEMSADLLRQVLSWKCLVRLRLHALIFRGMSTEALDDILPLGARLEKLHLWQEARADPELTVWTLIALARHLVGLVDLEVMLNVNEFDTKNALAASWNPFRALQTLSVSICAGSDGVSHIASEFATFLVAICPELEELTISAWNQS
ncbi:hypothetical protein FRC01_007707, partial [Tulasnella sp. 417]